MSGPVTSGSCFELQPDREAGIPSNDISSFGIHGQGSGSEQPFTIDTNRAAEDVQNEPPTPFQPQPRIPMAESRGSLHGDSFLSAGGVLEFRPDGTWAIADPNGFRPIYNNGLNFSRVVLETEPNPRLDWDSGVGLGTSSKLPSICPTAESRIEPMPTSLELEPEVDPGPTSLLESHPGSTSLPSPFPFLDTITVETASISPSAQLNEPQVPRDRAIDHDHPVDFFSSQDMADIKRAADLFSVISCKQEAFKLYATLLKRHNADPVSSGTSFWYLIVQSVHNTTGKREHLEVIEDILRKELEHFERTKADGDFSIGFLVHMLLAFAHRQSSNHEGVREHLSNTRAYNRSDDSWFLQMLCHLPSKDRSLDLVLFRNALRLRAGKHIDLTEPAPFAFSPFSLSSSSNRFESHILNCQPGPFQLAWNSNKVNPCLGSCLFWCEQTLKELVYLPMTPGVEDHCPNRMAVGWTEATALFFVLWREWIAQDTRPSSDRPIWMCETQESMGMSPTELLMLVCRVIHDGYANGPPLPSLQHELLRRLHERAERLVNGTDIQLAREFLHQYISHHTVTSWTRWRSDIRRLERARAIDCLQGALGVTFPGLVDDVSDDLLGLDSMDFPDVPHHNTNKELPDIPLSQTLAESLRSSNQSYSRFLKASARTGAQLQRFARGSVSIPSMMSMSLMRSGSKTSSKRMSELSSRLSDMVISGESVGRNRASSQFTKY